MQAKNFQWAKQAGLVLAGRDDEGEYQFMGTRLQWWDYENKKQRNFFGWVPVTKTL